MGHAKKSRSFPPYVYVQFYRASEREVKSLQRHLREYEAVEDIGKVAFKSSGAVELGAVFTVWVLPVLVNYAGTKILQIVEDRIKAWFKTHGHDDQFITLKLSTQSRGRKVGKGRPNRYG